MTPQNARAHVCAVLALAGAAHAQITEPFPPVFELRDLTIAGGGDGTLGTFLDAGASGLASDLYDQVDNAADVNGDGISDLIIGSSYGAYTGDPKAYVVFGRAGGLGAQTLLTDLDGDNGFKVSDSDFYSGFGSAVASAGDLNGDGLDDIAMGAPGNFTGYYGYAGNPNGRAYVLLGSSDPFPGTLSTSQIVSPSGTRFTEASSYDYTGAALAGLGDINGDGLDDLGVGAPRFGTGSNPTGRAYVVFGRPPSLPFDSSSRISTTAGLTLRSSSAGGFTGSTIAGIGDINDDGVADLAVSSPNLDSGLTNNGRVHVVFGRSDGTLAGDLNLGSLDGTTGFRMDGLRANQSLGQSVSKAGDLNGDGIADLAVGSRGEAYIIFGRPSGQPWPTALSLDELNGTNGFVISGFMSSSATSLAGPGDLNGDGFDDLVVHSDDNLAHVIYGQDGAFEPTLDVADLDGSNGFRIEGPSVVSVHAAGDMNADGVLDAAIRTSAGVFIIYGRSAPTTCRADLDVDGTLTIFDFLTFQNLFDMGDPQADFDGDGSLTLFDFLAFQNAFDAGCP